MAACDACFIIPPAIPGLVIGLLIHNFERKHSQTGVCMMKRVFVSVFEHTHTITPALAVL